MVEEFSSALKQPLIIAAAICIIVLYSGIVPCRSDCQFNSLGEQNKIKGVSGFISSSPSINSDGSFYSTSLKADSATFKSFSSSASGTMQIMIPSSLIESFAPGKLFSLARKVMIFESGAYIACSGSWSTQNNMFVVSTVEQCRYDDSFKGRISYFRALCRLLFKRLMYSWGEAGALILSLLSGSRDYLSTKVKDNFRNAGLSHILALSGMHLSFFSGLAGNTGKRIVGRRRIFIIQLLAILIFVWFAGLSPSLFRALLCSIAMLVAGKTSCKSVDFKAVLAGAFLVHAVCFPSDLFSAAFMLSYGALAGILTVGEVLVPATSRCLPPAVSNSISASAGAQLATTPMSCALFGVLTPIGLVASVIVSPIVTLFLTVSLFFILVALAMPFLSPLFGDILCLLYKAIMFFVNLFACVPPISLRG